MTRLHPRTIRRLTVALVLALVAGGCRSDGGEEGVTQLRVLMTDDWVTAPFLAAVREFERARPNVVIRVDKGPINTMEEEVRAGVASGTVPDVVQGHAFAAAAQGLAQPLDDLWRGRLDEREFFPGAVHDVRWAGQLYGVPLDTNAMVLMYNAGHLREAGLTPPAAQMTFEEFSELAGALTTADGSRRGIAFPTSMWWTYGWIRASGGETLEIGDDGRPEPRLDSPEVVGALSYLAGLVRRGHAFAPRAAEAHSKDAFALFQAGSVSMHASGSWDLVEARRASSGVDYGVTLMPKHSGAEAPGSAMGGSSLFIPKGSRHRELAFDFMVHLVSDPFALRFAKEEGRLPVRLRVFEDPFFQDGDMQVFQEELQTARPPRVEAFPPVAEELRAAVDAILREGRDPESTMREAQARARRAVGLGP